MRSKFVYILFIFCFISLISNDIKAQITPASDSLAVTSDSLQVSPNGDQSFLAAQVDYTAEDSIINKGKQVFLYTNAEINYENVQLKADFIQIDWETNTVIAIGVPDSTGYVAKHPEFSENGKSYEAERIEYNFNSKKGKIQALNTQEGEGYLKGNDVKKLGEKTLYLKEGLYTTCSEDHPHYYIGANRLKVIPGEKVITGPANLVIQDIPTPLVVPFGYFPLSDGRSSGILFPTVGFSEALGYNLTNGGYYFSISDHLDVSLRGDIYTKGSWRSEMFTRYNKRYHYNGSLKLNYANIKEGEEGQSNFVEQKDFAINWQHVQDPKANPYSRFSANVNAGSQSYYRNNSFNPNQTLSNTLTSSISYQRSWNQNKYNLTIAAGHNQNLNTNNINIRLPDITLTTTPFYPLKKAVAVGKKSWYEQLNINPTLQVKNEITTVDSLLFTEDSKDKFRYGARAYVPVNLNINLGNSFNLTTNVQYTSLLYGKKINKSYQGGSENAVVTDTISEFNHLYELRSDVTIGYQPTIYGLFPIKNSRIKAIRHVITPSISYTYRPNLGLDDLRYYDEVQVDEEGNTEEYSHYANGIFGTPGNHGPNRKGSIGFSLGNNLEMKVATPNDTLQSEKKIQLLERLSISSSYDLDAEEFNLKNFTFYGSTKISDALSIRFDGSLNPYAIEKNEEGNYENVNKFMWNEHRQLARLTRGSIAMSSSFNPAAKKEKTSDTVAQSDLDIINRNPDAFVDFNIPWDLNLEYKLEYSKPYQESTVEQTVNFDGNVNLTPKWKIGFRSGYNLTAKKVAFTNINIYRDLHCWEMRFDWTPFGFRRQYTFTIAVKASVLQDLKLNRTRNFYDL